MPLPLAAAPLAAVVIAIGLFFFIRWWLGRTGAALFFTLSLLLNLVIVVPVVLGIMAVREVQDFQDTMSTRQKLLLVERGQDILLAVSFTDVKDLEKGVSSFKPLSKEQVQRISSTTGNARYASLARDYYRIFVVEREFLERLAPPTSPSPAQKPSGQTGPQDNAALQNLLNSARDAFLAGDMTKLASSAAELQKAYGDRGMKEAADVARQVEQAAKAKDTKALTALGPKVMQLVATGTGGSVPPGQAGAATLPVSSDTIMKAIDSDDPAKVLLPYLPQQTVQEMSGGNPSTLKLMLIAYLIGSRFQNSLDPIFIMSEYQKGDIQVYPESNVSTVLKLLPIDLLSDLINTKAKL